MPSTSSSVSTSNPSTGDEQCEYCHSTYSLIKRKKTCAVCHQSFCTNCAPRDPTYSCRICVTCQLISNNSTTDNQLNELKVKQLRLYLQAKNISCDTCTEKRELIDLIKNNRQRPFTNLSNQQNDSTQNKSGPFSNIQSTVTSLAHQVNHIASNIQDYVSTTVSDVIGNAMSDQPPPPTTATANNNLHPGSYRSASSSPRHPTHNPPPPPTEPYRRASSSSRNPPQQERRPAPPPPTASSAATTTQRPRRKSLSEIHTEENIEDLNIRCVEKNELLDKVRRLYRDKQNEKLRASELGEAAASDTDLCKICMDAYVDCVFLDCGHMVTCVKCGKLLAECPICRSNIVRVVRVFKS